MTTSTLVKKLAITAFGAACLTVGSAKVGYALTVVDTTPAWDGSSYVHPFGQPDTATYGQTFTVPVNGDNALNSFSFFLKQTSSSAIKFAGYVTAWDGNKATGPILYQSGSQSTTQQDVFQAFNFATGGLNLTAGNQYVAFLNASNFADSGSGFMGQPQSEDVYSGGGFVFLNNGSDFSRITVDNWTKDFLGAGGDVAFKASFASPVAIPTPALLPGLIGLGMGVLRKRKAEATGEGEA